MAATQTTTTRSSTKAKLSSKPTILQILNDVDANEDKDNNKQIHAHDGDDDDTDTTSTNTKQTQAKQEKDKNKKKKKKKKKDEEEEEAAEAKLVLVPGTRVATADAQGLPLNTYEIGDELGRGTASRVYRATNVATGVVYAIKVTLTAPLHAKLRELPFLSSSASSSSSSSTAAALLFRHAHLVQVLEIARLVGGGAGARAGAGAWLSVMELLRGGPDLRASVRVPMPEVRARALFRQLVSALAFLHNRGVAHSALKPSNVLLHPRGGLRLADFAGNRRNPPPPPPPPYGAPEAIRAKRDDGGYWYDAAKADVYSAGVLLYEMVAGRPPPPQPFAFPSYFSAPLRRLLCGMLDPRSRMSLNAVMTSPWLAQLPPYPCVGDANSRKKDRAPVVVPHRQRRSFQSLLSCFGLSLD